MAAANRDRQSPPRQRTFTKICMTARRTWTTVDVNDNVGEGAAGVEDDDR